MKIFEKTDQVLSALRHADYAALRSTVYLRENDVTALSFDKLSAREGYVELQRYTSDQIILKVKNPRNSILVITNNFSPYWKATVDGIETKIFPVDNTFQGVYVRSGEHKVIIEYSPHYAIHLGS